MKYTFEAGGGIVVVVRGALGKRGLEMELENHLGTKMVTRIDEHHARALAVAIEECIRIGGAA